MGARLSGAWGGAGARAAAGSGRSMERQGGGGGGCCVCAGRGAPRYRCPGCRARYCSVPCYKKHKEQCRPKQDQVVKTLITDPSSPFRRVKPVENEGSHWSVDDILTEDDEVDRVPLQKLKLLEHLGMSRASIDHHWEPTAVLLIQQEIVSSSSSSTCYLLQ
nr:zinc finger HIT domain-containing protein 3 isoform X2 [Caretta caretta]